MAKSYLGLAASLLLPACTGNTNEPDGAVAEADGDAVAPAGLSVTARPGACGTLGLVALTLRKGTGGAELYVALRNDGTSAACSPAFSVELFDHSQQSVATGLGGLLVRRFYRLADGSGTIAACAGPGDVSMLAITDLPPSLVIEDVGQVVYWCNYWVLDVIAVDGVSISEVRPVARTSGVAYAGTLSNGFDVAMPNPSIAVFPLNGVGRPLGIALGQSDIEVPPGGRWNFETDTVSVPGVDHAAYPRGGP